MVIIQETNQNHKKPDEEKRKKLPIHYIFVLDFRFQGQIHPAMVQENSTPS